LSPQLDKIVGRSRFTPLALLLALSGVVVIAYVALGASFVRQHWDKAALSSQVELGKEVLVAAEDARQEVEDLQARLQAAQQELASAQSAFPSELDSSAVVETALAHASTSQVRVLKASTKPPAVQTEGENTYRVLSVTFDVEGGLGPLIAFLGGLESEDAGALQVKGLSLQESAAGYTMNLEVLAYARSPADQASEPETTQSSSDPAPATAGGDEDSSRNGGQG
jgi:competence protein ComGF